MPDDKRPKRLMTCLWWVYINKIMSVMVITTSISKCKSAVKWQCNMQTNYQLSKYVRCLKFPDKSKHQFTNKTKLNQHGILKKKKNKSKNRAD